MSDPQARWARVDRIFSEALDKPAAERQAFARERCGDDASLVEEVLELLRAAEDEDFLSDSATREPLEGALAEAMRASRADAGAPDPLLGSRLGAYRIVRAVGHGGMGSVYLGERTEGFQQQVAIKTLRRGTDTDEVVRRFLAERQILAQLDHPNIARLYDGGSTPDGLPYFVMELVRGEPITTYANERGLSVRDRLGLLTTVAKALQHAHQHLIVHRDLKPSNVLVTHDGVVKLLDFGIARLLAPEEAPDQTQTVRGLRVMTPAFAAPEQVLREPTTTATDVYQLGALAYELLSGARPFPSALSGSELERHIVEVDPEPASAAVKRAPQDAAERRTPSTRVALSKALAGDLDTILAKALSKEPERRYASAEGMEADLRRHLEGRPIGARPATLRYRFSRFTRRNRWFVPAAAGAAVALGLYVESSVRHNRALTAERNLARSEAVRAEAVTEFVTELLRSPNPWEGGEGAELTVLEALEGGAERIEQEFVDQPRLRARLYQTIGSSFYDLERLKQAEAAQTRSVELWEQADGPEALSTIAARSALGRTLASTRGGDSALVVLEPLIASLDGATADEARVVLAEVLSNLARVQWDLSQFDSAFVLYGRAREELGALQTPRPELVAAVLREHSRALGIADQGDAALELSVAAVTLLESVLPPDHVDLAAARWDLASALSSPGRGRQEEALDLFSLALEAFEKRLEPEDPNLLDLRYDRAYALLSMGRLDEAESEYRELLPLYGSPRRTARRYTYADVAQNLAATLKRRGQVDEAIEFSMQAHDFYERELGTHYLTAYPLLTVAEIELERGRSAAGRDLAAEAYDILRETMPEGHVSTWVALCRRGRGRWATGMTEEGLQDLELSSAALDASSYGPDHPYPRECRQALQEARATRAAGR